MSALSGSGFCQIKNIIIILIKQGFHGYSVDVDIIHNSTVVMSVSLNSHVIFYKLQPILNLSLYIYPKFSLKV